MGDMCDTLRMNEDYDVDGSMSMQQPDFDWQAGMRSDGQPESQAGERGTVILDPDSSDSDVLPMQPDPEPTLLETTQEFSVPAAPADPSKIPAAVVLLGGGSGLYFEPLPA